MDHVLQVHDQYNTIVIKIFFNGTDGEMCGLSEFVFYHWDPDGLLDVLNKKGSEVAGRNIKDFNVTSNMCTNTLKALPHDTRETGATSQRVVIKRICVNSTQSSATLTSTYNKTKLRTSSSPTWLQKVDCIFS